MYVLLSGSRPAQAISWARNIATIELHVSGFHTSTIHRSKSSPIPATYTCHIWQVCVAGIDGYRYRTVI